MNWTVVQRILGLLLMMFSLTMLPPVVISLDFNEQSWLPFVESFGLTLLAGLIMLVTGAPLAQGSAAARRLPRGRCILDRAGYLRCCSALFRRSGHDVIDRCRVRVDVRTDDDRRNGADRAR